LLVVLLLMDAGRVGWVSLVGCETDVKRANICAWISVPCSSRMGLLTAALLYDPRRKAPPGPLHPEMAGRHLRRRSLRMLGMYHSARM
jgi:hypothetical protein